MVHNHVRFLETEFHPDGAKYKFYLCSGGKKMKREHFTKFWFVSWFMNGFWCGLFYFEAWGPFFTLKSCDQAVQEKPEVRSKYGLFFIIYGEKLRHYY